MPFCLFLLQLLPFLLLLCLLLFLSLSSSPSFFFFPSASSPHIFPFLPPPSLLFLGSFFFSSSSSFLLLSCTSYMLHVTIEHNIYISNSYLFTPVLFIFSPKSFLLSFFLPSRSHLILLIVCIISFPRFFIFFFLVTIFFYHDLALTFSPASALLIRFQGVDHAVIDASLI